MHTDMTLNFVQN